MLAKRSVVVLLIGILTFSAQSAKADSGIWSEPIPLSGALSSPSQFPKIAAGANGHLHAVWGENSYADNETQDAIFYSRFDGASWSPPVDVLVSPIQPQIMVGELVILPDDKLALLWTGGQQLFLSVTPAAQAQQPNAWQTTPLLTGLSIRYAFMLYQSPSTLSVVVIDAPNFGLKFMRSDDLGDSWLEAKEIWSPANDGYAGEDPRLCQNESRTILHVVWHENARELGWKADKTWYMRSLDRGESWNDQFSLPLQGSSPNCAYDGEGKLHLLWNNAVSSADGRYHRWSADDGQTWSEPSAIFPGLSGRTRAPIFGLDNNGTLHVLTGAYAQTDQKTPMYWSYWQGQSWAIPRPISRDLPGNESPDLVVTEGNRLNAVWHYDVDGTPKVVFSMLQTNAPILPNIAVPDQSSQMPVSKATEAPTPYLEPTSEPPHVQPIQGLETPVTPGQQDLSFSKTSRPQSSVTTPIVIGSLSALLIVLGVFAANLRRQR